MTLRATPATAALAGIFSAVAWPPLWSRYGGPDPAGSVELIVGTLLLVALPAHAFVLGFGRRPAADPRKPDAALLARIGSWVAAGAATVLLAALVARGQGG